LGLLLCVSAWLLRPAWISAPAVVEYAPLTVIRCASPGFVEQVHVRSGQQVSEGQPILTLRNDELRIELNDLMVAIEQSHARARTHQQADELPKYQAELANREALERKRAEAQRRVEELTIRAPAAGRLLSRSLDWLLGQYLKSGDEVAVLGEESSKELLIAVAQGDLELFRGQIGEGRSVRVSNYRRGAFNASLARLEPRASQEPPHPALLATAGGPLAATPRREEQSSGDNLPEYQLLLPCFVGRVTLSSAESSALLCGQLLEVGFRSPQQNVAHRAWQTLRRWLDDQIAAQRDAG
jgi:putative peptide zinc metalloprotease protein